MTGARSKTKLAGVGVFLMPLLFKNMPPFGQVYTYDASISTRESTCEPHKIKKAVSFFLCLRPLAVVNQSNCEFSTVR